MHSDGLQCSAAGFDSLALPLQPFWRCREGNPVRAYTVLLLFFVDERERVGLELTLRDLVVCWVCSVGGPLVEVSPFSCLEEVQRRQRLLDARAGAKQPADPWAVVHPRSQSGSPPSWPARSPSAQSSVRRACRRRSSRQHCRRRCTVRPVGELSESEMGLSGGTSGGRATRALADLVVLLLWLFRRF
ncbi:hypothetical protein BJY59DRAFT_686835 [Rhodotorula toruloides]